MVFEMVNCPRFYIKILMNNSYKSPVIVFQTNIRFLELDISNSISFFPRIGFDLFDKTAIENVNITIKQMKNWKIFDRLLSLKR